MGILQRLRWYPTGRRLYRLEELKDGMQVEAIAYFKDRSISREIRQGVIYFDRKSFGGTAIYLQDTNSDFKAHLGYINDDGTYDDKFDHMGQSLICVTNRLKENQTMANKLLGLIKLNKNQRKLQKVGIYDENGNLTTDGQEVVLNLIAKDYEDKLVELSKDWKTDDKKSKDEE